MSRASASRALAAATLLAAAATLLAACKPARPTGAPTESATVQPGSPEKTRDRVVARIGDRDVTFGELEDVLDSLPVYVRMRYQSPERRRDFLEAYVQFVVLALAAESEGYGKDPAVLERLKADLVDRFVQERVDLKVKTTDIPEEQVAAYYAAHPFDFHAPERRHVDHILLGDAATAAKIAFRVRKTIEMSGGDPRDVFAKFAAEWSTDVATRDRGGDLGLFPRAPDQPAGVPQEVLDAVPSLGEPFQVSPVVAAADGFHVLFLEAVVPPVDQTLDQARPRIVERLMEQERDGLRQALLADLVRRGGVSVHADVAARTVAEAKADEAKARAQAARAASEEGGAQ